MGLVKVTSLCLLIINFIIFFFFLVECCIINMIYVYINTYS